MKTMTLVIMVLLGGQAALAVPSDTTCEEMDAMSQTEPHVTLPNGTTIFDSSKRPLGCGWTKSQTIDDFARCPDCGGEVANCWVGTEGLKTWSCVEKPQSARLTFGAALERLKAGSRIAREGWNGRGMWLVLIRPGNAVHRSSGGAFDMQPCIGMKTATHVMQPGWLASQADMLADDWLVISS